jgi:hypothetical protein
MSEIPQIHLKEIEVPEILEIPAPIVVPPPININQGFPVIDMPCAETREKETSGKDHFNNDPAGNTVLCDHSTPWYFAPDYSPEVKIIKKEEPKTTEGTEQKQTTNTPKTEVPKLPPTTNGEEEIECPAKDQQYRLGDLKNAEAREKVIAFEVVNNKCIEIWGPTNIADKYLPSPSVAATTFGITIVATSAATLTPWATKLLRPVFKQVITRVKKLLGKKQEPLSKATKRANAYREKKGLPPLKK